MPQFIVQLLVFLLASLISAGLIYISKSFQIYQQLIPVLLVLDIIIAGRINTKANSAFSLPKVAVLLISALLVQTIVISSGGLYSPLLILLHIFTLSAIFLLGSSSPIMFLIFSLGVLIFHISYDKNLYQFFQNDPWAVVIYGLSIIIVIPLALYLSHSNNVKNKFTGFLRDYIEVSEKRQNSILTALSNLVIVTDKNLSVISVNSAFERLLRLALSQVIHKPLFEVIKLKDSTGNYITPEDLPIKQALSDKATHFAEGYTLETKIQTLPKPVTIQIKPVTDVKGEVTQIILVFTDPTIKIGFNTHTSVEQALKKHAYLLSLITSPKSNLSVSAIQLLILQIAHIEEDILTVQEMEDHPLQEVIGFEDLVTFINRILEKNKHFYTLLGGMPQLKFEDENNSETAFLNLYSDSDGKNIFSKYSAPIDGYLLKMIVEKIIDLSVFISSSQPGKNTIINMHLVDAGKTIIIDISFPSADLKEADLPKLFIRDYPGLKLPTLKESSGLEGYIASKIAKTIQLDLITNLNPYTKLANISIALSKQAKITPS